MRIKRDINKSKLAFTAQLAELKIAEQLFQGHEQQKVHVLTVL